MINKLSFEGIKLNITAIYTYEQIKKVLKNLNKKTPTILSIFAGRMADKGKDPLPVLKQSIKAVKDFKKLKFFGPAQGRHIILLKQNRLDVILLLCHRV